MEYAALIILVSKSLAMRRSISEPSYPVNAKSQHQVTARRRKRRRQPVSHSHAFLGESEFELAYPKDIEFLPDGQYRWGLEVDPRIRDAVEHALRLQQRAEARKNQPGYIPRSDNLGSALLYGANTSDAISDFNLDLLGSMDVPTSPTMSLATLFGRLNPFVKMRSK